MAYIIKELNQWVIDKIEREYKDDVALLIGHEHWRIKPDGDVSDCDKGEAPFNFFIPRTDRGYELSKTFIIDDIGYDLFPMSWERVEGLAKMNETLTTCLGDGVILYARSEEERARFEGLQEKLSDNLNNEEYRYIKGLEDINKAMDIYKGMCFEESITKLRKGSGYIAGFILKAIADINGVCLQRGPENRVEKIREMKRVPCEMDSLMEELYKIETAEDIRKNSYRMIQVTRDYFKEIKPIKEEEEKEYDYAYLSIWYEEGRYTFRRIIYYCDMGDVENAYAWGGAFQQEFDFLMDEFGFKGLDLLDSYDPNNLQGLKVRAMEIEEIIRKRIIDAGVKICEYDTLEEFLKNHG